MGVSGIASLATQSAPSTSVSLPYDESSDVDNGVEEFDHEEAARWVEDRVMQFVQRYLQLEFADQYQQENLVTDPVGSERFVRIYAAAGIEYHS